MYRRTALVVLAMVALVALLAVGVAYAADADFSGVNKPFTKGHQLGGTTGKCQTCHASGGSGGGYNAHATHQRTLWLKFKSTDGCPKCHGPVAVGAEGDLSYTDTDTASPLLRRTVDPALCVTCHGRFRTTGVASHAAVTIGSNCLSACHKPDGSGSASSATTAHTGVTWVQTTWQMTTVPQICRLCHGADGTTGLSNRVWYLTEETN